MKKSERRKRPEETGRDGREKRGPFRRALLVEFLSVALGVFLALLANQWREDRSNRCRAEKALAQIELEIRSNREILRRFHQNNGAVLKRMEKGRSGKEDGPGREGNFSPALQLESAAWKTLLSTGTADFLDFERVRRLSSLYSIQEVYRKSALLLVEAGLNMSAFAAASGKDVPPGRFRREFLDYMRMIFRIEESLLEAYGKALEEISW